MVCLQERKCYEFREENCFRLWGSNDISWVENGVSDNVGTITMWRKSNFQLLRSFNGKYFSVIEGV